METIEALRTRPPWARGLRFSVRHWMGAVAWLGLMLCALRHGPPTSFSAPQFVSAAAPATLLVLQALWRRLLWPGLLIQRAALAGALGGAAGFVTLRLALEQRAAAVEVFAAAGWGSICGVVTGLLVGWVCEFTVATLEDSV